MEKLPDSLQKLNHLHSLYIQHGSFASWNSAEQEEIKSNLTYHSNKIEGLTLTYGETIRFLKDNLVKPGIKIKDLYDLKNHQEVLGKIFTAYDQIDLSEQTIKGLHAELMKDDAQWEVQDAELAPAGHYKINDNFTYRPGGYHIYLPHAEVPKAMDELISQTAVQLNDNSVKTEKENHPAVIISRFHFQFLQIHPFADGNGRMARLLTSLLLLKHKFPPVIIEEQERQDYFQRLINSEKDPDRLPIVSFFVDKCISSLTQKLSALGH